MELAAAPQSTAAETLEMTPSNRLTQTFVHKVESTGKKARYPDHEVSGLALRVTEKGAKSYVIRYRKPDRSSGEMTLGGADVLTIAKARDMARRKLAEVADGGDPLETKRAAAVEAVAKKARTLAGVVELYRRSPAFGELKANTRTGYNLNLDKHILPRMGSRPVEDIGRKDVAALLDALVLERSGSVSNSVRSVLSVVMSFAVERELIDFNPVTPVKLRHKPKRRERVLSDAELRRLWQAAQGQENMTPEVASIVALCMALPARRGEIAGLRWREVDWDKGLWTIPAARMKADRSHELPLGPVALDLLEGVRERTGHLEWAFPDKAGTGPMDGKRAGRACARLAKAEGWESFGPHDLRRSIATRLAGLGLHREMVERVLSHDVNGGRAIAHYDHHSYREEKRRTLEAWEQELMRIVEGRAPLPASGGKVIALRG